MTANAIRLITFTLAVTASSKGLFAQEFSPFSPAFILKSGQVESSTSVGANWYNGNLSSPSASSSPKFVNLSGSQSITAGLPHDFQIGVVMGYSDWVSKSPANLNITAGFSNPSFYASKIWFGDTDNRLNFSAGITPKTDSTGTRGLPSTYNAGLTGVFILNPTLVSSIGASMSVSDKNGAYQVPDSTQLTGSVSKVTGAYLVNLSIAGIRTDSLLLTQGYRNPGYGFSGALQVSRQLSANAWGALAFATSNISFTQDFNGYQYSSKNLNNSLTATLRLLF